MTKKKISNVFCSVQCGNKDNCLEMRIGEAILTSDVFGKQMAENMAIPVEIHTLLKEAIGFVFPRVSVIAPEREKLLKKIDKNPDVLTQIAIGILKDDMNPDEAVFVLCNGKKNQIREDKILQDNLLKIVSETTDEDAAMRATKTLMSPFVIDASDVLAIAVLGVRAGRYKSGS